MFGVLDWETQDNIMIGVDSWLKQRLDYKWQFISYAILHHLWNFEGAYTKFLESKPFDGPFKLIFIIEIDHRRHREVFFIFKIKDSGIGYEVSYGLDEFLYTRDQEFRRLFDEYFESLNRSLIKGYISTSRNNFLHPKIDWKPLQQLGLRIGRTAIALSVAFVIVTLLIAVLFFYYSL